MSRLTVALLLPLALGALAPGCEDIPDVVRYEDGEIILGLPGQTQAPEILGAAATCDGLFDVLLDVQVFDPNGIDDISAVNATILGPDGELGTAALTATGRSNDEYQGEFDLMGTAFDCNDDIEVRYRVRDQAGHRIVETVPVAGGL